MRKILGGLLLMSVLLGNQAYASCSVSATPIDFGQYNPFLNMNNYSQTQIRVNCVADTDVVIKTPSLVDSSQLRTMQNIEYPEIKDKLYYRLFTNAGRDMLFGDGNNGTYTINTRFTSSVTTKTLYGTLIKNQNVYKGAYADTLLIELNY